METALKSDRELTIEKVNQRNKRKTEKKNILQNAEKLIKTVKIKNNVANTVPQGRSWVYKKMKQAQENIKEGTVLAETQGFTLKNGIEYYAVEEMQNEEAIARHHNDPNIRLDECGFPKDRSDRHFLLKKDFGENLNCVLKNIKSRWIYLFGDPGQGKTSLAIRSVWELIKDHPTKYATFLSVGKWTDSLRVGKEEYLPLSKLKKIVVVDDFGKFDPQKGFQIRQLLLLVEELKNRHLVIFTSNYARDEILSLNQNNIDLEVMLDRVKGKSIDFPRFTGESHR